MLSWIEKTNGSKHDAICGSQQREDAEDLLNLVGWVALLEMDHVANTRKKGPLKRSKSRILLSHNATQTNILIWLVVWGMNFIFFHHIGKFIIPTDELHHFSEG